MGSQADDSGLQQVPGTEDADNHFGSAVEPVPEKFAGHEVRPSQLAYAVARP